MQGRALTASLQAASAPPHVSHGNRKGIATVFVVILGVVAFLWLCAALARRSGGGSSDGGGD